VSNLPELITQVRQSGNYQRLADAVPYTRFLGISAELSGGALIGKLTFSEKLIGNPSLPALHGGTLAALLESTAIFTLLVDAETRRLPKIINITIAYLRSGRPVDTFAKSVITKHGRRVAAVHVNAWQDDPARPIATAIAHFLIDSREQ
jgi:acyl-coenzyme A thioesterase PaaI-like protein